MADVELFPSSNVLKQELFFIVDFKSLTILPPFIASNKEEAKRNFINLLNYSNSTLCKFPEDFKLYAFGEFITSFTGTYDTARQNLERFVNQFPIIATGDSCIQPDTSKYDELNKKVENALQQVSNSNNVLVEQIGKVPNLDQAINVLTSKVQSLSDKFIAFENDKLVSIPIDSKKSFFDKIFS